MNNVRYKPLPNDLYRVKVPAICTYTAAERDLYGLPMDKIVNQFTGATTENHQAYNNLVKCMLSLDRIIDIYINGYPIYLLDQSDLPIIYKTLDHYVSGYSDMEKFSPNAGVIVDERMEQIQTFLKEIYGWNKGDIVRGLTNSNQHGWGIDIPLFRVKPTADVINVTIRPEENRKVGVLAGYENPQPAMNQPVYNPYQQQQFGYEQNPTPGLANYNYQPVVNNVRTIDTGSLNSNTPRTNDYMHIFDSAPQINIDNINFKPTYRKTFKS